RERWAGSGFDDLNKYIANRIGWLEAFQRNPHEAREQWVRMWGRTSPFHFQQKAAKAKAEPHPDLDEKGKREWQFYEDVRAAAYDQAAPNRADEEDFMRTRDMRAILKEKMPGSTLSDFLEKCRQVDICSLDNPGNVGARFAAFFGAPVTEMQVRELQA